MKPAVKLAILLIACGIAFAIFRMVKPATVSPVTPTSSQAIVAVVPASADNLINMESWVFYNNNEARGSKEILSAATQLPKESEVVRIHIDKKGAQIFDVGFTYHFKEAAFTKGEMVTLRFKARSSSKNLIAPQMQRDSPPQYLACWTKFIPLTPEWKEYTYVFTMDGYAPGEAALVFKLGQSTGIVDLADISLLRGDHSKQ